MVVVRTLHLAWFLENSDYAFHMTTTKNDSQSFSSGRLGAPPANPAQESALCPALCLRPSYQNHFLTCQGTRDLGNVGQGI